MERSVWIDTDAGLDDALSILVLLRNANVLGICCSYGNCTREQVVKNVQRILSAFHANHPQAVLPKIYLGADKPYSKMVKKTTQIGAKNEWHGYDGLGDKDNLEAELGYAKLNLEVHSEQQRDTDFEQYCRETDRPALVSIGPMTLASHLVDVTSNFSIYGMCGCFSSLFQNVPHPKCPEGFDIGNMKFFGMPFAEHNIACDPVAAEKVFSGDQKIIVADWGLTIRYGIPLAKFSKLCSEAKSAVGRFYSQISQQYKRTLTGFGYENVLACDSLAAYAFLHERDGLSVVQGKCTVCCEPSSPHFAETTLETTEGDTRVIVKIDQQRFEEMIETVWN